jgi:hypothetical protein
MKHIFIALLLLPCIVFGQTRTTVSIPSTSGFKFDAYRYSPGVEVKGKSPVIIAYPGTGETTLASADSRGLPGAIKAGLKIPFTVITIPFNSSWYDTTRYTKAILNWIWKQPDLDTNRVYMTGLSAGANGTYRYIESSDDRVSAFVPISVNSQVFTQRYGDKRYTKGPRKKPRPIWSFHGAKDGVPNELATTKQYIVEYNALNPGLMVQTVFTNKGHDAWTTVYTNNQKEPHTGQPFTMSIYDWMLKFTLWPEKPKPPVDPPVDPKPEPISQVIFYFYYKNDSVFFVLEGSKKVFKVKVEPAKP